MIIRFSKIVINTIFTLILFWGIACFTGYLVLNEFIATDYFKNLVIKKLNLRNDIDYDISANGKIHWNPFAFGVNINNFSFKNKIINNEKHLVNCSINEISSKFSIINIVFGSIKPKEIAIKNSECSVGNDIFLPNNEKQKTRNLNEILYGIKKINGENLLINFNDKIHNIKTINLKHRRNEVAVDLSYQNAFFDEIAIKGNGKIANQNSISYELKEINAISNKKIFKYFPKIDSVTLNSSGSGTIIFDDLLNFHNATFSIHDINGNFSMTNNGKSQQIKNGMIHGLLSQSIKFNDIQFDIDNTKIRGDGEFFFKKNILKSTLHFKSLILTKIKDFWPSNIAPNSRAWYEKSIQNGTANGFTTLNLLFDSKMNFIEQKSKINLDSTINNGQMLCCDEKLPLISDIDGKIQIDMNSLRGNVENAKIDNEVNVKNTIIDLNFFKKKLSINGEAGSKIKNLINIYKKDYQINIFGDDILKNVDGDGHIIGDVEINLKNSNINTNLKIESKNLSTILETNNAKINNGILAMSIKNNDIKISLDSKFNGEKFILNSDINNKNRDFLIKIDNNYDSVRHIVDPIIGKLLKINKKIKGSVNFKQKSDNRISMMFDLDLTDSELSAQYLRLNKKIGENAKAIFTLDKNDDNFHLNNFNLSIDSDKKHNVTINNLSYINGIITANNIAINNKNRILQIKTVNSNNIIDVQINAENIYYDDFNWLGFTSNDKNITNQIIKINGITNKFSFHDDSFFSQLAFDMLCEHGDCQKIAINNCNSSDKSKIDASLINNKIIIATNNSGKLLNGINISNHVQDGKLFLDGSFVKYANGEAMFQNSMIMKNFYLKNAPIITKILSFASLSGLLSIFTRKGVHFNQMNSEFIYYNDTVFFAKSIVDGESMGINFSGEIEPFKNKINLSGSLTPMNFINNVARKIPILGEIFVGTRGEGLFAADFKIKGELNNPKVSANPVSFFTPHAIKKIFKKKKKSNY